MERGIFYANLGNLKWLYTISEGNTKEEAIENIKEAIELYLEPIDDDILTVSNAEKVELALWVKFQVWIMTKS